jgi:hypothetical protein
MKYLIAKGLLIVLLAATGGAGATTPCVPPSLDRLSGAWLGGGESGGVARLVLEKDGRGRLVIQEYAGQSPVSEYRITATRLSASELGFALEPVGEAPATALTGAFRCGRITLSRLIRSAQPWAQEFHLQREAAFLRSIETVRRSGREAAR